MGATILKILIMKMISTKTHGVMDYVVAVLLIASPWLFGFHEHRASTLIPIALGIATICYSMITDYEMSITKVLTMRGHLILDMLSGAVLAASPWIFGFSDYVYMPHLVFGVAEIAIAAMTDPIPSGAHSGNTHSNAIR
jgi:hypothetical protein